MNSLALLTGVECGNRNRQPQQLKQQAAWETVHQILSANARLLVDGPGHGSVYYYDVHSVEYTGMDSILKGWLVSDIELRRSCIWTFFIPVAATPAMFFMPIIIMTYENDFSWLSIGSTDFLMRLIDKDEQGLRIEVYLDWTPSMRSDNPATT